MAHALATLLGHEHPLFSYTIAELERAAHGPGIDTTLLGDILQKGHTVLRTLGMDPAHTTAYEAYQALTAASVGGKVDVLLADSAWVLLQFSDGIVSFNAYDVIENAHHQLAFAERSMTHALSALRRELVKRYAEFEKLHPEVVHQKLLEAGIEAEESHAPMTTPTVPKMLAIGDVFTDAFIQLEEEHSRVFTDEKGEEWLAVPFGQKPPYKRVDIVRSVGPSPNAAVSFARLGLDVELMAWVGGDQPGREAIAHLAGEGIRTDAMVVEPENATSYWYVLRYQAERTMLVKSEKFAYQWKDPAVTPEWIYLSYIGEDSWGLHEQLLTYLAEHPDIRLAFQPGSFHFQWGVEKLREVYQRAEIVMVNREEAMSITSQGHDDLPALFAAMHALGPRQVIITDGPHGSYASDGTAIYQIPNYPDIAPPYERTGAGDAFASTVVAGLAQGKPLAEALLWAPINSMHVVQKLGAQQGLLTPDVILDFLAKAPADYRVSTLSS